MLSGRVGVIVGVANKHSIAFTIAKAWHDAGCTVVLASEPRNTKRVEGMVSDWATTSSSCATSAASVPLVVPVDVTVEGSVEEMASVVAAEYPKVNCLLHSVASAGPSALKGCITDVTREDFTKTMDVSVYSLLATTRALLPSMQEGGSVQTLTYLGSERAVQGYGMMGVAKAALESSARYLAQELGPKRITVNCLSPGPMNTVSARGIPGFTDLREYAAASSPVPGHVNPDSVGSLSVLLASPAGASITGQTIYVDNGFGAAVTQNSTATGLASSG